MAWEVRPAQGAWASGLLVSGARGRGAPPRVAGVGLRGKSLPGEVGGGCACALHRRAGRARLETVCRRAGSVHRRVGGVCDCGSVYSVGDQFGNKVYI